MKHSNRKAICVYCGASNGVDSVFARAAKALGHVMAQENINLVYGGASVGLMGEVARAVLANSGHVTSIRPPGLPLNEAPLDEVQEYIPVDSLHERKMKMYERSDAFVALPGGVGTLEELVEQITWSQLGMHSKPVIIANINGYWSPLLDLLDHMKNTGFIADHLQLKYHAVSDVKAIIPLVQRLWMAAANGHGAVATAP
ncbi:MAG: TIGR00730 family Rossman fold protein [Alphaproteobacteria bacterium]